MSKFAVPSSAEGSFAVSTLKAGDSALPAPSVASLTPEDVALESVTQEDAALESVTQASSAPAGPVPVGEESLMIGCDVGGTNVRVGVISPAGEVLALAHAPTPQGSEALVAVLAQLIQQLAEKWPVAGVGVAVAGFLDERRERVRFAPHLALRDAPLAEMLEARIGLPVAVEHDANSAAWGEYYHGAARGEENWVLVTLGTGIGGAVMIDGALYRGAYGTAPEFGHLTVVKEGRPCACGKRGCLERYCSGTALEATAQEFVAAALSHGSPETTLHMTPSGKDVIAAARNGDPVAMAATDDVAEWLGYLFSLIADLFDPSLIVVGGGMSSSLDMLLPRAEEVLATSMVGAGHRPVARVAVAQLGEHAGMVGAAAAARRFLS